MGVALVVVGEGNAGEDFCGGGVEAGEVDFCVEGVGVVFESGLIGGDGVGGGVGDEGGVIAPAWVPEEGGEVDGPGVGGLGGGEVELAVVGIESGGGVAVVRGENGPGGGGELAGGAGDEVEKTGFGGGEEGAGVGGIAGKLEAFRIDGGFGVEDFAFSGLGGGEADEAFANEAATGTVVEVFEGGDPGDGHASLCPDGNGDARAVVGEGAGLPVEEKDVGLGEAFSENDAVAVRAEEGAEDVAGLVEQGTDATGVGGIEAHEEEVGALGGDVGGAGSGAFSPDDFDAASLGDGIKVRERNGGGRGWDGGGFAGGQEQEEGGAEETGGHGSKMGEISLLPSTGAPAFLAHLHPQASPMSTAIYNRKNPCLARLSKAVKLSAAESPKDTRHYELSLEGSGMEFEPGDSLAVLPTNDPELVEEVLAALGWTGAEAVNDLEAKPTTLREALISSCALTVIDKKFLAAIVAKAGEAATELAALLAPEQKEALASHLYGREVIDFLLEYPQAKFEPQEFVSTQKKVLIRLYSISSSLKAHPDAVHLTVATVRYESRGRKRLGVASTFLAERVDATTLIPTFINPGKGFRLPAPTDATPIIMCGPGTGIAPFRAFLQERAATKAAGKAWLFFGEISRATDYFYEEEWNAYLASGVLKRLDLAFSRDQAQKLYVQHKMVEAAAEMYAWLEEGAIFYVCGDASRMAADVDRALHQVLETAGGKSPDEAQAYVAKMKEDKRYRRDVY